MNILLIEDNIEDAVWVDIQLKKISRSAYKLHTCDYFSRAQKLVHSGDYSLVILDLCLPDSKGLDTLKTFVESTNLPVIIYTGISDKLVKEEAFKAGIADYLVKGQTTAEELSNSIFASVEKWKKV